MTTIQYAAFAGCSQLTEVNFANKSSIKEIGIGAFCDVPIEFNIDFPNLIGTLGYAAFQNTKIKKVLNLGSISIIDGVNDGRGPYGAWGSWGAFKNCTELTYVNLPTSITTIGIQAFAGCTSLEIEDLSLPNLKTIGLSAFSGVKITKISNLGKLTSLPNLNSNQNIFGDKTTLISVNLPNTLTSIGNNVFNGYSSLANINLPASLTTIRSLAFSNCTSITGIIDLPNLETLGQDAFSISDSKTGSLTGIENLGKITAINNAANNS